MKTGIVVALFATFTIWVSGQTPVQPVQVAIDPIIQKDAPVQIVAIKQIGDNLLATVTVKNTTARAVQDFDVDWAIFRPVGCAVSGPAPRLQRMGGGGQSTHAEARGTGTLPPGYTWGSRPLKA
jgi:hypothetical protein